jgi:hypothetical protein
MFADLRVPYRPLASLVLKGAWFILRGLVFAILVIVEPIARVMLSAIALISLAMAFLFEFSTALPEFPFWGMLGVSLASLWLLVTYYALIRLFGT